MKVFLIPYARMDDVDFLVEDEKDTREALNVLRRSGYSLYSDRYSLNPLKTTAISSRNSVQVDIYPEATWFNMRYADRFLISSNKTKRNVWGVQAYMPNPSLDVYIIATHSYNHGFISLAEAAHVVRMISEFRLDWAFLRKLAGTFRLDHALLLYLRIAQQCIKDNKNEHEINELVTEILGRDALSRVYSRWLDRALNGGFPLKIPVRLRLLSASTRLFRPSLSPHTEVYDELAGYGLAFLFRGDRRNLVAEV